MSISVAIVIPAYREGSYIENTLRSIEKSVQFSIEKQWLPHVIVVVNNPPSVSEAFRKDNQYLIKSLNDLSSELSFTLDVLDYTDPGLSNGVGEARKLGMNYALAKYLKNPDDLIVSLDADCFVDLNYITTLFNLNMRDSAFTFYFEHNLDSDAIVYYELYLRYLRWGLKTAKSPFAFYSVGSCMGTTKKFYEKSGGMVAKSATEDFHFLNKLRKHGSIAYITETTIHPSSRLSQRVTLGTGYFLTDAKVSFDKAFEKLMLPFPDDFLSLSKILKIIYSFNGETSIAENFAIEGLGEIYNDLHKRGVIQNIHKIRETTTKQEIYHERLMEAIDGLESLRILRFMWIKRNSKPSRGDFLSWCNQLWSTKISNPKEMLLEVRAKEKLTAFVSV